MRDNYQRSDLEERHRAQFGDGKSVVNSKIGFDRMAFSASSSAHYDVETYSRSHRPGVCAPQLAGNDGEIGWAGNGATHCAGWCPGSSVQGEYLQIELDRPMNIARLRITGINLGPWSGLIQK